MKLTVFREKPIRWIQFSFPFGDILRKSLDFIGALRYRTLIGWFIYPFLILPLIILISIFIWPTPWEAKVVHNPDHIVRKNLLTGQTCISEIHNNRTQKENCDDEKIPYADILSWIFLQLLQIAGSIALFRNEWNIMEHAYGYGTGFSSSFGFGCYDNFNGLFRHNHIPRLGMFNNSMFR
jgi:hypothetical protein